MNKIQLTWTDEQWAAHLKCAPNDIPRLRKWVYENYCPSIVKHTVEKQYSFVLTRRQYTPSGFPRYIPIIESAQSFCTSNQATEYANEKIIPNLEMNDFWARANQVPAGILQMLHIEKLKQK
ncbi:MAG: hypothetical protein IKW57_02335 [Alphaproteobacteria bacterium]|nr:hypothetical protein [Alphaproteobacteria bacterium]